MSFFQDNQFDAKAIDTTNNFDPIPEGIYRVLVVSAEERPTANGNGQGLNVQYEVVEGQYKGRKLFHWINLRNQSKVAEEIGHKALALLCLATNVPQPRSPAELCGKLIQVVVKVTERNGEKRNEIKAILLHPSDVAPTSQPTAPTDAPAWGQ